MPAWSIDSLFDEAAMFDEAAKKDARRGSTPEAWRPARAPRKTTTEYNVLVERRVSAWITISASNRELAEEAAVALTKIDSYQDLLLSRSRYEPWTISKQEGTAG
jgi:hypothetical protein